MMFDGSKLTRLPFLPFRYGTILASEVNGPNAGIAYHPIEAKAFDLDYLKMMPKIRTFRIPMWDGLLFDLAPISEASNGKNNELHILPDRPHLIGIFNIFAILPDRALGPIKIQIGEDTPRFQDRVAEQTKSAPPRDRLPPEYQKDQRTWVEKREDLHAIQPGIHLDMVRAKGGTKLVLKFRLPWLRQDSVHLDLDPYVLQGMDVPQGIKEIGLVITSPHGNQDFRIAIPAHPLGDGTCAGSFLVDPKSMLSFFDIRVYSVYAVANGQLAGPLMAERDGVHWLQPGLPKPKLRTKAWDPAEEGDSAR